MRYAPAYSAEQFPGDFAVSALCGCITAAASGPLVWWVSRQYLQRAFPGHPEVLGAAVTAGILDAALFGVFAFCGCFALRVWLYERRERQLSDAALQSELADIERKQERGSGTGG